VGCAGGVSTSRGLSIGLLERIKKREARSAEEIDRMTKKRRCELSARVKKRGGNPKEANPQDEKSKRSHNKKERRSCRTRIRV